ncbi:MAG: tRNA uridine(34) 5-carboxymethylaminomethyl modification radical SAM/GNAT enzyme Elp3 [Candidatus Diapherotrites archaeon]|uniref:tRNA carboxymethyluridine synthase n=1 Tax=Candidatus Iainarchaeum sp. TaxID=3101447 RepID=A0A2D6LQC8_9ARCH|nr:tRNA uridine(34) 5-carboxymethylaminomethyl modification radical SAM/GNAT enzyme Elp3 [Candidatus Diapherotrites archaeon]
MTTKLQQFCTQIIEAVEKNRINTKDELNKFKLQIGKEVGLNEVPSNPDILSHSKKPSKKLSKILSIKPLRTLSGVAPIAIMTKPIKCPHGTCIYCPGGPDSFFGDVPQSYTGNEPATMRAISNSYDSYLQTMNRLSQYYSTAHNPQKLELIIMGGTFPSFPFEYQEKFISEAFQAVNDFSENMFPKGKFDSEKFNEFFSKQNKGFNKNLKEKLLKQKHEPIVEKEHLRNEKANVRIVTMCIETKPDWCKEKEIDRMLKLGTTRVELGAQSTSNDVLKYTNRGHTIDDTIEATRLLKDSGLKVTYHMMPGQPLSSKEKDVEMFKELFENPDFKPDGLKIYPCMVMPGTALEKLYENGKFTPLDTEEAAEIISEAKKYFPSYTRVHRVQRDIPTKYSKGGVDKNNLRQIIEEKAKGKGIKCKCIRCRESGINQGKGKETDYSKVELVEKEYEASKGKEVFISFEDTKNELIVGFCRLRKPWKPFREEFTEKTCVIRELHVLGSEVGIGKTDSESTQHKGFGKKLMEQAEKIAKEKFSADKLLVISGVGAREYYLEKLGYKRDGIYMGKILN